MPITNVVMLGEHLCCQHAELGVYVHMPWGRKGGGGGVGAGWGVCVLLPGYQLVATPFILCTSIALAKDPALPYNSQSCI